MEEIIINETLETYKNTSVRELKMIVLLTKILKNMHSSAIIFIFSLLVALFPVSVLYFNRLNHNYSDWVIFPIALIIQFVLHKTFTMNYLFSDAKKIFQEQQTIQQTLENMIKTKKPNCHHSNKD